ncbi:MAG: hypothetical protein Kow0076_0060 [Francisella sp.]
MNIKSLKNFSRVKHIGILFIFLISSCAHNVHIAEEIPLLKKGYSKKNHTTYNIFGFPQDSAPSDFLNIFSKKPTEFLVQVYIADNNGCQFTYLTNTKGKKEHITQTSTFKTYISDKNELLKLECTGKNSNIDYKISTYVNGREYYRVGNLSYIDALKKGNS